MLLFVTNVFAKTLTVLRFIFVAFFRCRYLTITFEGLGGMGGTARHPIRMLLLQGCTMLLSIQHASISFYIGVPFTSPHIYVSKSKQLNNQPPVDCKATATSMKGKNRRHHYKSIIISLSPLTSAPQHPIAIMSTKDSWQWLLLNLQSVAMCVIL